MRHANCFLPGNKPVGSSSPSPKPAKRADRFRIDKSTNLSRLQAVADQSKTMALQSAFPCCKLLLRDCSCNRLDVREVLRTTATARLVECHKLVRVASSRTQRSVLGQLPLSDSRHRMP